LNYTYDKLGERIKGLRKEKNLTQTTFAELFDYYGENAYQTVSNWEKGNNIPPLEILLKICKEFACEIGYLLGAHDAKTRVSADVQDVTGLSEDAVNELQELRKAGLADVLSRLITHKDFFQFLCHIDDFAEGKAGYEVLTDGKPEDEIKQEEGNYYSSMVLFHGISPLRLTSLSTGVEALRNKPMKEIPSIIDDVATGRVPYWKTDINRKLKQRNEVDKNA